MFSTTMDSAIDQCAYQIFPTDAIFISSGTGVVSPSLTHSSGASLSPPTR